MSNHYPSNICKLSLVSISTLFLCCQEECDLQGFEEVFAVKFPPRAIAAKRHIHLSNLASYLQGMYI